MGNRTQVVSRATTTGSADTTLAYGYPAAGSAGVCAASSVTVSGGRTGTSRAVAGKTAQTSSWDAEGELAKVTEGSTVTGQYVYTANGERLLRRQGGKATSYLPRGTRDPGERDAVANALASPFPRRGAGSCRRYTPCVASPMPR